MKVVINRCYGGFGLSEAAYKKLIEWGIPVRKYVEQRRDPKTKLFLPESQNEGEVIFDRTLSPESAFNDDAHIRLFGRYWESWTGFNRTHPLVVRVVEELGDKANGNHAALAVVEIPDGVEWEIDEHDGVEHIAETHRTWR